MKNTECWRIFQWMTTADFVVISLSNNNNNLFNQRLTDRRLVYTTASHRYERCWSGTNIETCVGMGIHWRVLLITHYLMAIGHISSVMQQWYQSSCHIMALTVSDSLLSLVADDKLCCGSLCKLQTAWEHNAGKAGNELAGNWTNCMRTLPAVKSDDGRW